MGMLTNGQQQMMNDDSHHLLFGCHIDVDDVAPGMLISGQEDGMGTHFTPCASSLSNDAGQGS